MASAGRDLFVNLEVVAWEDAKPDGAPRNRDGRFKGRSGVERAARKGWNKVTDQTTVENELQAFEDAQTALRDGPDTATSPDDQRTGLTLRTALATAIAALIVRWQGQSWTSTDRVERFLVKQRDQNNGEIATLNSSLAAIETVEKEPDEPDSLLECPLADMMTYLETAIAGLDGDAVAPTDDLAALGGFLSRKGRLYATRVDAAATIDRRIAQDGPTADPDGHELLLALQSDNDIERPKILEYLLSLDKESLSTATDLALPTIEIPTVEPDADALAALDKHKVAIQVYHDAYSRLALTHRAVIDVMRSDANTAESPDIETREERLNTANADVLKAREMLELLTNLPRIAAGRLQQGWVLSNKTAGAGAYGKVETWVKQNHFGVIVQRLAIKNTHTAYSLSQGWNASRLTSTSRPLEVDAMYRIQDARQPGHESVVRILNWRRDPERTPVEKSLKGSAWKDYDCYRIYMEWCGHDDLLEAMNDNLDPFPPEAFLWAVFESLTNACQAMENHQLMTSPSASTIVHQDLKPSNVFLSRNTTESYVRWPLPKIGDFGHAVLPGNETPISWNRYRGVATPDCMPPEQADWKKAPRNAVLDVPSSKSNIWGVGIILWSFIGGEEGDGRLGSWVLNQAGPDKAHLPMPKEGLKPRDFTEQERAHGPYSDELVELIMHCLEFRPADRPTLDELSRRIRQHQESTEPNLKTASAADPVWDDYLFKLRRDLVEVGMALVDVKDRAGVAISLPLGDDGKPPEKPTGPPKPDDYGGGTGLPIAKKPVPKPPTGGSGPGGGGPGDGGPGDGGPGDAGPSGSGEDGTSGSKESLLSEPDEAAASDAVLAPAAAESSEDEDVEASRPSSRKSKRRRGRSSASSGKPKRARK
ncbi:Putative serine/threonine-protein kinase, active [Septoria linicola]|uniref:non-specific serine/threonine protein kinase n=1 Tax=Septoria linicola TaxID=215465 RepID=A0A9Q9EGZ0_9PEZI|nr:putative serine/threonine-protein kinase, active [Septoria linicola]USW50490.1 Putative serine/threonine-protein kinase, active [Septoria linicola]